MSGPKSWDDVNGTAHLTAPADWQSALRAAREAALREAAEECEGYGAAGEMVAEAILALIGEKP